MNQKLTNLIDDLCDLGIDRHPHMKTKAYQLISDWFEDRLESFKVLKAGKLLTGSQATELIRKVFMGD